MTKTNYEKLQAAKEKMYEIRQSTTSVALQYKTAMAEKRSALTSDRMLSPEGRKQQLEAFKRQQGAAFIKQAASMRAEFDKAAVESQVAAELFLLEDAPKPSDTAVQTFDRKLTEFQTELLLATNPDQAMTLVNSFIGETQDPYFASRLKGEMPAVIREVITLAKEKAPLYKVHLGHVVDGLNFTATSGKRNEVQQVLDGGSRVGEDVWHKANTSVSALQQALGSEYSNFANNPADFRGTTDEA